MHERRGFRMATSGLRALLLMVALASSWAMVARATVYDGLPRPNGFPENPTAAYGTYPEVYIERTGNQIANCAWYGFANVNFPADICQQCLAYMRSYTVGKKNDRSLRPYSTYSYRNTACYDRVSRTFYGFHACYYLNNSTFVIPPISDPLAAAPPPPRAVTAPSPPGTPAALLPPPGTGVGQPPPAGAARQTNSVGSRSLQAHASSAAFLAVCAAAVSLVTRL